MTGPRTFKPPPTPPHFTGMLWLNADKSIGGIISDVFNHPINLHATKEGQQYRVRGWRGEPPEFLRIPLIDDKPHEDGLPERACPKCEGRLYWRESVAMGGKYPSIWRCAVCEPADPAMWLDGCAAPDKPRVKAPEAVAEPVKEGTLL